MAIETKILGTAGDLQIALADSTLAERFSEEELEAAWKLVCPKTHWKDRIDALVPVDRVPAALAAIEWYTGTEGRTPSPAYRLPCDETVVQRVVADGYWLGPCN